MYKLVFCVLLFAWIPRSLADCVLSGTWTDRNGVITTITQSNQGGLRLKRPGPAHAAGTKPLVSTGVYENFRVSLNASGVYKFKTGLPTAPTIVEQLSDPSPHRVDAITPTGTVGRDCNTITWSDASRTTWYRQDTSVTDVHVIWMGHLDVGFTNFSAGVCDLYFNHHFPQAVRTAQGVRSRGYAAGFKYTSHPWLIAEYLDGKAGCGSPYRNRTEQQEFVAAIQRGDILWHASPFLYYQELVDKAFFEYGLTIRDTLNVQYNTSNGKTCAKLTDITGMSRSAIPLFSKAGVRAIHIGYNVACTMPKLPSSTFVWRHLETQTELVTMTESGYGKLISVPNLSQILKFFYSPADNGGPPSTDDAISNLTTLRYQYPGAHIFSSSLDNFTRVLLTVKNQLPVVTAELGDGWLYGAPADPYKMAAFREVRHATAEYEALGKKLPDAYNRRLLNVPEHNYGLSVGQWCPELQYADPWDNSDFHKLINQGCYVTMNQSWAEKRSYLMPQAPNEDPSLAEFEADVASRLHALRHPSPADQTRYAPVGDEVQSCTHFDIQFSPTNGSISYLFDKFSKKVWASGNNTLGQFRYQTFTEEDFDNVGCQWGDFRKPGMDGADPVSATWYPVNVSIFKATDAPCSFFINLQLSPATYNMYGAPRILQLNVSLPDNEPKVYVQIKWFNKTLTRLAEAMWLSFNPIVNNVATWQMDVLGSPVSPLDVVDYGTRHIHGVWSGVTHFDNYSRPDLVIETRHVSIVSPGDADHLLNNFDLTQPNMAGGWHFNLYNNLWGTAFNQWYGQDGSAQFVFSPKL